MERIFVTGMGIVSALGSGREANLQRLRSGQTGVGKARFFESNYAATLPFAEVDKSNETLHEELGLSGVKGLSRTTLIALSAFREAIADAQLTVTEIAGTDTAFISASTVGGMCHTDQLYRDANLQGEPSEFAAAYEGADHVQQITQHYALKGITDTINTACSSSANAIMLGARLIRSGRIKRAIVGGADSLAKYTVNGFNSLRILSETPCQPFDVKRQGLNLGEAAAYLVLEGETTSANKQRYAELTGYGNSNDAFHPSATSDTADGPVQAMQRALAVAQLEASAIDYINAHGTGTENNDVTELHAFKTVFGNVPPYSSTKSFTGHTLGAAGSVEAIFSIFALCHDELYPSLRCNEPLDWECEPITAYRSGVPLRNAISNSFGFGGNCTSLIFKAIG